jgi:hypothetical protein
MNPGFENCPPTGSLPGIVHALDITHPEKNNALPVVCQTPPSEIQWRAARRLSICIYKNIFKREG